MFGPGNCIWYQQNHSASKGRLSNGLCSIPHNQQQSPWLRRKNYIKMYWWPLCHIVSLLCLFKTQWVAYGVLFKSPCIIFFYFNCCFSDDSIIGNFNSAGKTARTTSSGFPPDVLSPYTARKSTKVFLPRSQKSCSVFHQRASLSPQQLKCFN